MLCATSKVDIEDIYVDWFDLREGLSRYVMWTWWIGWGDLEGSATDVLTAEDRMSVTYNEDWYCWVDGFAWTCSNLSFPVSACLSKFLPFSSHIRYNCHQPNLQRFSMSVLIRGCHFRTTVNIYKTTLNSRQSWRYYHYRAKNTSASTYASRQSSFSAWLCSCWQCLK